VPGHDVDGGLLSAHLVVKEVVGLQVQHARRLLGVDLLGLGGQGLSAKVGADGLGHIVPVHNFVRSHSFLKGKWLNEEFE
jgi:hypothetical protein